MRGCSGGCRCCEVALGCWLQARRAVLLPRAERVSRYNGFSFFIPVEEKRDTYSPVSVALCPCDRQVLL